MRCAFLPFLWVQCCSEATCTQRGLSYRRRGRVLGELSVGSGVYAVPLEVRLFHPPDSELFKQETGNFEM